MKEKFFKVIDNMWKYSKIIINGGKIRRNIKMSAVKKDMLEELYIKDSADLKRKLNERIKKIESGKAKMYTIEEAFEEIDKI